MKLFDNVEPVLNIDEEDNILLKSIDSKLNEIKITDKQKRKYMITKSKVRSIHSSLSIEANSLSLFDVENISENKSVLGKKDEVQEVKNAIAAQLNVNVRTVKRNFKVLIDNNIIERVGSDKNGYWEVLIIK